MAYSLSDGEAALADDEKLDVRTMITMLVRIHRSLQDDEIMEEASEAVADAVCLLSEMRALAAEVADEDSATRPQAADMIERLATLSRPLRPC
ncbi:MAG: hypothetical protein AAFZ01_01260 [Pseudomonadota bacterium]